MLSLGLRIMAAGCVLIVASASADGIATSLSVKPSRCIALHQGQTCYASLTFRWETPATGEYCLFDERQPDPLVCWAGNKKEAYKHELTFTVASACKNFVGV